MWQPRSVGVMSATVVHARLLTDQTNNNTQTPPPSHRRQHRAPLPLPLEGVRRGVAVHWCT